MNVLDGVILEQHSRIIASGANPVDVLHEAQGEVLAVATPELTLDIICDSSRVTPARETRSVNAQLRAFQDGQSVTNRATAGVRMANGLARLGMVQPDQGYVGGILFDGEDAIVYGRSMVFNRLKADDPIQAASGVKFYPPMMWVKALRAAAYEKRPESARFLSVAEYLAKLGLTLGSMVTEYGDLVGATGFMPGKRLEGEWDNPDVQAHILSEDVEVFRLSGLCDQAVVDPIVLTRPEEFAQEILSQGGSLN